MFWSQVSGLIKKNFLNSLRNGEIIIESLAPIIISLMLSLKRK